MYIVNELHIAEPYMLKHDGVLLSCGVMHPYIKYIIQNDNKSQIRDLFGLNPQWIMWCKHNTIDDITKQLIVDFLNGVSSNAEHFEVATGTIALFEDWDGIIYDGSGISVEETEKLFVQLNDRINNEFCRVRTSAIRWGGDDHKIYFRISSKSSFDWLPHIKSTVNKYKDFIESVSIVNDVQSLGGRQNPILINDIEIWDLPTSEFLNLKI